jgi:dTDP-4-dehydrorhamnose reductase
MLGHVVVRYLGERGFVVATTEARFSHSDPTPFAEALASLTFDDIANCVGRKRGSEEELFEANAELPRWLVTRYQTGLLVHASSDGVFSGRQGPYALEATPDAEDPYGRSKRAAEAALRGRRAVVLRCSIVGPELGRATSLLSWLITQAESVTGYTDHLWNGITTLAWAKLCAAALERRLSPGLHQPACTTAVSKAELLTAVAKQFAATVSIDLSTSGHRVDRRLVPTFDAGPIEEQLRELADWYPSP